MKTITLNSDYTVEVTQVYGGKELYQGSRREYLEFVVPQEGNTVEALDAAFTEAACSRIIISEDVAAQLEDAENEITEGEEQVSNVVQYIHEGYTIRGGARVWMEEDSGKWYIAIKRYQRTQLEQTVAQLQEAVASLQGV